MWVCFYSSTSPNKVLSHTIKESCASSSRSHNITWVCFRPFYWKTCCVQQHPSSCLLLRNRLCSPSRLSLFHCGRMIYLLGLLFLFESWQHLVNTFYETLGLMLSLCIWCPSTNALRAVPLCNTAHKRAIMPDFVSECTMNQTTSTGVFSNSSCVTAHLWGPNKP